MRFVANAAVIALVACSGQAPLVPPPAVPRLPPAAKIEAQPSGAVSTGQRSAAPAAPAAPLESAPPVSLGDIGNTGPVSVLAASSSGSWVALCQGEPSAARLVLGSGTGDEIDDLLAQSPNGRYVVISHQGVVELIDSVDGTHVNLTELGADVRRVRADYAEHRSLSFDPASRLFAYLRQRGSNAQIVVRELQTGTEQVLSPGAGEVFRLRLSADARYVIFDAIREDTSHNGKLDWPAPEELASKNPCERPALPKFRSFGYQGRGDAPTRAVIALADGVVRDLPELVTPLGSSLLLREQDGSLRLDRGGKLSAFAPAGCAGRVLFADAERELALVACVPPPPTKKVHGAVPAPNGKREVWLFGAGYAKNLQSELYETATDREASVGVRLVPLYPGSDSSLVDLERREVLPLPAGSRVVTTSGAAALIWRESDLFRYDAQNKSEQRLAHGVLKNPDLLQAGSSVLLSPFVIVDLNGPALASPARPLSLSAGGFVLTASVDDSSGSARGAIRGPLHWVDARLPPPDGPPR